MIVASVVVKIGKLGKEQQVKKKKKERISNLSPSQGHNFMQTRSVWKDPPVLYTAHNAAFPLALELHNLTFQK